MKVLMMTVGKKLNLSRKVMVLTMMMGSPSFLLPWTMKMVIHCRKAKVLLMVTWCHQRKSTVLVLVSWCHHRKSTVLVLVLVSWCHHRKSTVLVVWL
jgi:hypothetical protein